MHLYISIFWKGKTKNKFAENKRFSMWKTCYYHAANDCLITVENCIFKTSLPFFKVLYQRLSHRANITAKQNHCRRQYHASGISLPKASRFPFREMRRTLLFWNRIVGGGNANSYACLRLFLHASTKVSCVGFIIRCPFREMRRMLLFWPTDCRKRQSVVLCLHTPFPREYTVSRGDPNLAMPRNDVKCVALIAKCLK